MEAQFWISAWEEGRTNFHQQTYNVKLLEYFPLLNPLKGQKVLVPLCGKTKDLVWLRDQNLHVEGYELYEKAVLSFFQENALAPEFTANDDFKTYFADNIRINVGDFFKLSQKNTFDLIYDRASLVALPEEMRKSYAKILTEVLKPGGKYLLLVFEYDQAQMEGPPFSVDANEIHRLYQDQFTIKLMESERPPLEGSRFEGLHSLRQKVYILEKK